MSYERTHWQQTAVRETRLSAEEFEPPTQVIGYVIVLVLIASSAVALAGDAWGLWRIGI